MKNICIFGDSITRGAFDEERGGWAQRFAQHLMRREMADGGVPQGEVYVFGIDGDTVEGVRSRLACEVRSLRYGVDTIIIAIGINDAVVRGERVVTSEETFARNLRALVAESGALHVHVVLVGLTRVNESLVNPLPGSTSGKCYRNERIRRYDAIIRTVAEEVRCPFVPMHDVLSPDDLYDGLHPTARGHEKMFRRVVEALGVGEESVAAKCNH